MRGLAALLSLALVAGACSATPPPQPPAPPPAPTPAPTPPPAPVVISVVGTSDLHGALERAVVFGGYLDNLRNARESDGGVLVVDAGDMFQGTIAANESEGAAVIRAYNALGYQAATIGNHEFDYGPVGPAAIPSSPDDDPRGALLAAAKQAHFPLLAANIATLDGQPVRWDGVVPSTLVEVAGIPVGIVGVTTSETKETTIAGNVSDLRITPLANAINEQAGLLRERGAKVVIAAAHAGAKCTTFESPDDLSSCEPQELFALAQALQPGTVDVLIGAHTHQGVAHRVHGIPVIQSYAYGTAFGRVDLSVDPTSGKVTVLEIHPPHRVCEEKDRKAPTCTPGAYEGAPVVPSEKVRAAVADDIARAKAKMEQPIGVRLEAPLTTQGRPSSPLGDRVAAWMLEVRPSAQVAIINSGGVRANLPQGPLTYGAFYEMFPFDNRFASARVKVRALRELIRTQLEKGDGFSIAGVQVIATCEKGGLRVELRRGGRVLGDEQSITLLLSDYLAMTTRVGEAGMPKEIFAFEADPAIREALVEHLGKKGGVVSAVAPTMSVPSSWPVSCSP